MFLKLNSKNILYYLNYFLFGTIIRIVNIEEKYERILIFAHMFKMSIVINSKWTDSEV